MKRHSLLLGMMFSTIMLTAQTQSLGVQIGFSEPILRQNTQENTKKLSDKTVVNGLEAGIVYDATLIKGFGMSFAINYAFAADAGKWEIINSQYVADKGRTSHIMHTIEMPIDWQYKFKIATDTWLIAYTGPVLQYTFSFNTHFRYRNSITGENMIDIDYKTRQPLDPNHYHIDADEDEINDYTPFNIQWGIGAGFQYQNYYIRGGYNFGIYNHFRDSYNNLQNYTSRARIDEWNIRVGIYFLNF